MPGGIWTSQNKVRPGAYINFEGEPVATIGIGERGIAAITMPLSWGGEDTIINVLSTDLLYGDSLKKVGLKYEDAAALPLRLALANCALLKVFNSNTGGVTASATIAVSSGTGDGLVVTAKHPGTFGNKIAILINVNNDIATVETYADGFFVDRQKVPANHIEDLVANDFVSFDGDGTLVTTESTLLTNGTNGGTLPSLYSTFFGKIRNELWNTVAITSTTASDLTLASTFIKDLRESEGKYVQAVVANSSDADYEGVINVVNGVLLNDGTSVSAAQFTAWVAGATAGAYLTESLTGKVVTGATSIVGQLSNTDIINALNEGKFVLAMNQDGSIRVEKDINSLHTFVATKGYEFSKNRIIRELDEIAASIKNVWERTYMGKVSNNDTGRTMFKSSIIDYMTSLQNVGAIQGFNPESVQVEQGDNVDAVVAYLAVKPVDAMEFLYMTITVS